MAKLTTKGSEKEQSEQNTQNIEVNLTRELNPSEQKNLILDYLNNKNFGMWTPEAEVEKAMDGKIHYYHVRQLLSYLRGEKYLAHTNVQESYQITADGKRFIDAGGYKN